MVGGKGERRVKYRLAASSSPRIQSDTPHRLFNDTAKRPFARGPDRSGWRADRDLEGVAWDRTQPIILWVRLQKN